MAVTRIHHFNLRVGPNELETLQRFYCDVLGFHSGPRPSFPSAGVWLYAGEIPLVHLTRMHSGETVAPGTPDSLPDVQARRSAIDHIALASEDLDGALQRLAKYEVSYTRSEVPATGQVQLFLRDPAGTGIELIFPMSAAG